VGQSSWSTQIHLLSSHVFIMKPPCLRVYLHLLPSQGLLFSVCRASLLSIRIHLTCQHSGRGKIIIDPSCHSDILQVFLALNMYFKHLYWLVQGLFIPWQANMIPLLPQSSLKETFRIEAYNIKSRITSFQATFLSTEDPQ
jgi:hypothetical protein